VLLVGAGKKLRDLQELKGRQHLHDRQLPVR